MEILPEHGLGLPELVLHYWDELAPHKVIQKHDVQYVEYEYCAVAGVFHLEAIKSLY